MVKFLKCFFMLLKGQIPMKPPQNKKELEDTIRKFFEIDRALPKVVPAQPASFIGKMIVIPDTERSLEDINEDIKRNRCFLTREDLQLWENVNAWFKGIKGLNRYVVIKRCQGKGWKRIAKELVREGHAYRYLHRATLWRHFNEGLEEILKNV